jgi:hypothetical protein
LFDIPNRLRKIKQIKTELTNKSAKKLIEVGIDQARCLICFILFSLFGALHIVEIYTRRNINHRESRKKHLIRLLSNLIQNFNKNMAYFDVNLHLQTLEEISLKILSRRPSSIERHQKKVASLEHNRRPLPFNSGGGFSMILT